MIGEYSCPYLCNTGKACGNPCIRPEGCRVHWKSKNGYHVLIVVSQLLLLVADAQVMLEAIMLFSFMTGFDQKVFDQKYKKDFDFTNFGVRMP